MPREDYIGAVMRLTQRKLGLNTQGQMANRLGMSEATYKNRLRRPGDMRMHEIWKLISVCKQAGVEFNPDRAIGRCA